MNVGVIGAGFWGQKHVEEYLGIKDANLTWVADPSPEATVMAKKAGVPYVTNRVDTLLDSEVEAVSICVPNDDHFQIARQAIRAGKNVLVEKPLTDNYHTSQVLVEEAREAGVTLAVGHVFRFNNAINELRRRHRKGFFGEAYSLIARWTTLCPPIPDRGVIFDLTPHAFDIMHHVLGEWPTHVTAVGKGHRRPIYEEAAFVTAEFPSGTVGHVEASWLLPGKVRSVELVGSVRSAHVDALNQYLTIHDEESSFDAGVKPNNTIRDELVHFLDSCRNGHHSVNSGEIGRDVVRCVSAAVESMRQKRTVEVSW